MRVSSPLTGGWSPPTAVASRNSYHARPVSLSGDSVLFASQRQDRESEKAKLEAVLPSLRFIHPQSGNVFQCERFHKVFGRFRVHANPFILSESEWTPRGGNWIYLYPGMCEILLTPRKIIVFKYAAGRYYATLYIQGTREQLRTVRQTLLKNFAELDTKRWPLAKN